MVDVFFQKEYLPKNFDIGFNGVGFLVFIFRFGGI
jgi:hypothetical protein